MRKLYEIGPLQLDPEARVLTHAGAAVQLGARGVAVLIALVSRANEYVQKSALLDAAWPGLVVEEANLAVQISAIRRALALVPGGEGWIETLARRGYRFVGPVREIAGRSAAPLLANRKRTNLPESLTSFVGRERELAEIKQRLPTTRLMTLTGIGGLGKTRLAQQAAAEMLDAYRDGVWFVDLAPLGDPALVPSAVARVLQVKEVAGQPLLAALCNHLRTRETLLILDNCEHVLDACARMTEALLRDTAQVTVMATSREALHLAGECAYPLSPLPLPDPQADAKSIARSDAVQLFTERARQHRPRLDLEAQRARVVAEICVRLDGIPLALELAAARVAVLPVEQILRLLTERFRLLTSGDRDLPRHQTLRAMLDWSYDLLDDTEKKLFARLSVFAGGWTLDAAGEVCSGTPITKDDLVYVLIGLIEQSLVVSEEDGDRYRMLETVRQYARDRLVESGEGERWRDRHLAYFLALAEEAEPKLNGPQQRNWLDRLEREHDNLRSALTWAGAGGDPVSGMRLASACWRFWLIRGYAREGLGWLSGILAAAPAQQPTAHRSKALLAAGTMAKTISDYSKARTLYEEALSISRELGVQRRVAAALGNLGMVAAEQGDYPAAIAWHEQSLAIWRELGDRLGIARDLISLGNVVHAQGDALAARSLYEESLAIERELGDQRGTAVVLHCLAGVAYYRNDYAAARLLLDQALVIRRELGDRWGIASTLTNLGMVAHEEGNYPSSRALLTESLAMRRDLFDRSGMAESLEALAGLAFASGLPEPGARLCGHAARLRDEIGSADMPSERARYDRRIASARASFGNDAAFDLAWQEGRAMTLEQAIEYALQEQSADG
jgi:non-specific serine/threonine protein kinase